MGVRTVGGKNITVSVSNPSTTVFSEHNRDKVKTAFTTTVAGAHWVCLQNEALESTEVAMKILTGPQAKDFSKVAKKEHMEEAQVALLRVEENLKNYHNNVLYMRAREERMRQTNDSTALRVICLCLFDVVLLVAVGG